MRKLVAQIIGGAFVIIGLIGMLTPIPLGLIFFLIGLLFLIPTTPFVLKATKSARRRINLFDRIMEAATHKTPYPYRKILRQTRNDP